MCLKRTLKLEDYKHCLEATPLENKINHLGKDNLNVDDFQENYKEFIKNNKLILKTKQRFRNEKHNAFTEEINKIALSSKNTINRFSRNLCIRNQQRSSM